MSNDIIVNGALEYDCPGCCKSIDVQVFIDQWRKLNLNTDTVIAAEKPLFVCPHCKQEIRLYIPSFDYRRVEIDTIPLDVMAQQHKATKAVCSRCHSPLTRTVSPGSWQCSCIYKPEAGTGADGWGQAKVINTEKG